MGVFDIRAGVTSEQGDIRRVQVFRHFLTNLLEVSRVLPTSEVFSRIFTNLEVFRHSGHLSGILAPPVIWPDQLNVIYSILCYLAEIQYFTQFLCYFVEIWIIFLAPGQITDRTVS